MAQSQNQLSGRCKIRVLCYVYVFEVKIIQKFIWLIITNENVSISCVFVARDFENWLITLSEKDGVRMPSEIIRRSKFFIWFLFASCMLWASEFGRMQLLILTTKEYNEYLLNNFSTAEIRTFTHCILNSLTSLKEIISFLLEFDNDSSTEKPISIWLNFNLISLLCRSILVRLEHASIASDLINILGMFLINSKRWPFMWGSIEASVWYIFRNSSNMLAK